MSREYDEYLASHVEAVVDAAVFMFADVPLVRRLPLEEIQEFLNHVAVHDLSKHTPEEYCPYDEYFYGTKDEEAFNRAWLHHIHNNPHHWQHWVLLEDDGTLDQKVRPLEMPRPYALEMIADWWSFSWRSGDLSEVFSWYEDHRDKIILHESTREFVERVLDGIREAINGKEGA